ncbi:MAG: PAS domain-containing protein, partial [Comamonadaceae bacterium]
MSVLNRPYFTCEEAAFAHVESIVWANGSFCELFRVRDRGRVLGATLEHLYESAWDRSPATNFAARDSGLGHLREHLRFAGAPFELALPDDGCCRVIARPARDGAVFHALIDISALKQYEAALQLTLDNAGRGIIRYDADGRVLLFNRQALELLGLPEGLLAAPGRVDDIVRFQSERGDFRPDDDCAHEDVGGATIAERTADLFVSGQYLRHTPSGRVLEICTNALPDGGAVRTYSDVTEYVQAQQALSEKTRALQITLDSMSQGISAIDASGRLVFWNRRYQELLKLPESLLAPQPTMDQIVRFQIDRGDFGQDFEFVDAVARGYVAVGDKLAPIQGPETYVRKTPDGRTFDVNTRPLPDGGVVRTFTDMTAYVRTQEELARKQAQLGALVNNLPDRVWLKDERGTFLLSNPAHRRYHGRSESEILGRTSGELARALV